MSLISHIYHIVIRTKYSQMTIREDNKALLYKYIGGIIKKHNGKPIKINGIANHIHMLVMFKNNNDISALVHDIKLGASYFHEAKQGTFSSVYSMGTGICVIHMLSI